MMLGAGRTRGNDSGDKYAGKASASTHNACNAEQGTQASRVEARAGFVYSTGSSSISNSGLLALLNFTLTFLWSCDLSAVHASESVQDTPKCVPGKAPVCIYSAVLIVFPNRTKHLQVFKDISRSPLSLNTAVQHLSNTPALVKHRNSKKFMTPMLRVPTS